MHYYTVISTKAGYAVQDQATYTIVCLVPTKAQAQQICDNLNGNLGLKK